MSLNEIENQKAGNRIDLDELPKAITAKIVKSLWKEDTQKRNCLYVEYETLEAEPKNFTQKYSPMHLADLAEAMKKLKIENLEGLTLKLKQKTYRIGFPRMIPEAVV